MFRTLIVSAVALAALSGVTFAQSQHTAPNSSATKPAAGSSNSNSGTSAPASSSSQQNHGTQSGAASVPQGMQAITTATVPVVFMSVQPADVMSSKLIGTNVYNAKNETIGEIEDLAIDNGKAVRSVIISVGGFLGIGERYVAVDPAAVTLMRDASGGNLRAMVNTTSEELKNAPTFSYSARKR